MKVVVDTICLEDRENKLILYQDQMLVLKRDLCRLYCALYDAREGRRVNTSVELPFHVMATVRDTVPNYIVLRKVQTNRWGDTMAVEKTVICINCNDMYVIEKTMKRLLKNN